MDSETITITKKTEPLDYYTGQRFTIRNFVGTSDKLKKYNDVFQDGELVVERSNVSIGLKSGDGSTHYNDLPYIAKNYFHRTNNWWRNRNNKR